MFYIIILCNCNSWISAIHTGVNFCWFPYQFVFLIGNTERDCKVHFKRISYFLCKLGLNLSIPYLLYKIWISKYISTVNKYEIRLYIKSLFTEWKNAFFTVKMNLCIYIGLFLCLDSSLVSAQVMWGDLSPHLTRTSLSASPPRQSSLRSCQSCWQTGASLRPPCVPRPRSPRGHRSSLRTGLTRSLSGQAPLSGLSRWREMF